MSSWRPVRLWIATAGVIVLSYAAGWFLYPVWAARDNRLQLPAASMRLLQSEEYTMVGLLHPAGDLAPGDRVDIYGTIESGDPKALVIDAMVVQTKPTLCITPPPLLIMMPKKAATLFNIARDIEIVPTSAIGPPAYKELLQPDPPSE